MKESFSFTILFSPSVMMNWCKRKSVCWLILQKHIANTRQDAEMPQLLPPAEIARMWLNLPQTPTISTMKNYINKAPLTVLDQSHRCSNPSLDWWLSNATTPTIPSLELCTWSMVLKKAFLISLTSILETATLLRNKKRLPEKPQSKWLQSRAEILSYMLNRKSQTFFVS